MITDEITLELVSRANRLGREGFKVLGIMETSNNGTSDNIPVLLIDYANSNRTMSGTYY